MRRVIDVLDKNKDGSISFFEFVHGLNSLSAGASNEEKLRFAFQIYDMNNDGYISNGELFTVLKMMVGNNLTDVQLQQLVDRTIIKGDTDHDGMLSFDEFCNVSDYSKGCQIMKQLHKNRRYAIRIDSSTQIKKDTQNLFKRLIRKVYCSNKRRSQR